MNDAPFESVDDDEPSRTSPPHEVEEEEIHHEEEESHQEKIEEDNEIVPPQQEEEKAIERAPEEEEEETPPPPPPPPVSRPSTRVVAVDLSSKPLETRKGSNESNSTIPPPPPSTRKSPTSNVPPPPSVRKSPSAANSVKTPADGRASKVSPQSSTNNGSSRASPRVLTFSMAPSSARTSSSGRKSLQPAHAAEEDANVSEKLKALELKRAEYVDNGEYLQAETVHNEIVEIRLREESKRLDRLRTETESRLASLEEAHLQELKAFNAKWDDAIRRYDEDVEQAFKSMKLRHAEQLKALREESARKIKEELDARTFPASKQLLEMRRSEKALAKTHEYRQAQIVKEKADRLQEQEIEEGKKRAVEAVRLHEERIEIQIAHQLEVLEQRGRVSRDVLLENRRKELAILMQRYQNQKAEIELTANKGETPIGRRIERLSPTKSPSGSKWMTAGDVGSSSMRSPRGNRRN